MVYCHKHLVIEDVFLLILTFTIKKNMAGDLKTDLSIYLVLNQVIRVTKVVDESSVPFWKASTKCNYRKTAICNHMIKNHCHCQKICNFISRLPLIGQCFNHLTKLLLVSMNGVLVKLGWVLLESLHNKQSIHLEACKYFQ